MIKRLTLIKTFVLISLLYAACGMNVPVTPGIHSVIVSDKDHAKMIYVPEGEFIIGFGDRDYLGHPAHKVILDAYWIDQTEVTNAMYAKCVADGVCKEPIDKSSSTHSSYYGNSEFDDYPVIYVDWNMARNYCEWRGGSVGKSCTRYRWTYLPVGRQYRLFICELLLDFTRL